MAMPIERTDVYQRACALGDETWRLALAWPKFAQDNLGGQLVRSLDSVAANLVEGDARGSDRDTARFFVIARSSAREARHWLIVSRRRSLIPLEKANAMVSELTEIVKMINGLITHRRSRIVKESPSHYDADDDLSPYLNPDP